MRIDTIAPGTRSELAVLESQILTERGRISPLYQVLLNSPSITQGWEQMLSAVRNRNSLSAGLRELVILRVAILNRAPYEFDAHVPHALAAGAGQAAIDATRIAPLDLNAPFSTLKWIAMRLTDTMTRDIDVPDELFAQVQDSFDARAQIDLMATIAAYNMVSRFLMLFHIGH